MNIAVVGSGYVGLVAATCLAELGHKVVCVDNDPGKVAALRAGEVPIHEKYLPELLARHRGHGLTFTGDILQAVAPSTAIFIAVGTPPNGDGEADLSYVESVARSMAGAVNGGYKLVVGKSTVPVYTSEWIRRVMVLNGASAAVFDVASNPEFLREGTAVSDFLYGDRIVLGANNERAAAVLDEIYAPLTSGTYAARPDAVPMPQGARIPTPAVRVGARSAELIKHASNAFLALKISFINAVANICESVGADIEEVREGIGADSRIGTQFLQPGIGYGGSCFPKDLLAFRAVARESGYDFGLLEEIVRINDRQRKIFLRKVRNALWTLKGKRLAVLGLAFKGGTDDIRESPAIAVVEALAAEGCEIVAYDPAATLRARAILPQTVSYAADPYGAARDADALLILTNWQEFGSLDLARIKSLLRYPILIDGRNLYSPAQAAEHGLQYFGIGRPDGSPLATVGRSAHAAGAGKL